MSFAIVFFALFAICQIMAAVNDALSMKIPNMISLVLLAGFVLIMPFAWVDFATFGEHVLVGVGVFAVAFGMFAAGWLGPWLYRMFKDETKMPYGIALAIGALVTLPKSQIYLSLLGA